MRAESERMDFAVGSDNGKNCAEGVVGSISFHNKLSIRDPMSKNRSSSKSAFKSFKGSAAIISEGPFDILAREAHKRKDDVRVIANESPVEVSETKEGLYLFDFPGLRPVLILESSMRRPVGARM